MLLLTFVNYGFAEDERSMNFFQEEGQRIVNTAKNLNERFPDAICTSCNPHNCNYDEQEMYEDHLSSLNEAEKQIERGEISFAFNTHIDPVVSNWDTVVNNCYDSEIENKWEKDFKAFKKDYESTKSTLSEVSGWGGGFLGTIEGTALYVGLIIGFVILILTLSLRVFGSGLAGAGVQMVIMLMAFLLTWFFLSGQSWGLITDVPIVGRGVWYVMTFCYFLGAIFWTGGGG